MVSTENSPRSRKKKGWPTRHLGNGSTLNLADSTININDGAGNGATATTGKINGAANFNATSEYIDLGSNTTLQPAGAISTSAWIKGATSQLTYSQIVSNGDSTGGTGYNLYLLNSYATFILDVGGWGSGHCFAQGTSTLNDNNWHYVVGTYAGPGGAVKVYVDGVQQTSSTCPNLATGYGTAPAGEIGWKLQHAGSTDFNGAIDEVRIAPSVLSPDWIATEYNNQNSPSTFFTVGSANSDLFISSLSPATGLPGTSVTITGTQFGLTQGTGTSASTVTFNGTTASVTSWSDTSIVATVPSNATSGNVVVKVLGTPSNGVWFGVGGGSGGGPSISSLSTTSGPIGTPVTISGGWASL